MDITINRDVDKTRVKDFMIEYYVLTLRYDLRNIWYEN